MRIEPAYRMVDLLHRRRANRRSCFMALGILLVSTAGVVVDAAWTLQSLGEPVRWFPFVGLAVVAVGALWLVLQLLRDDRRLVAEVRELVLELEEQARAERLVDGVPYRVQAGLVEVDFADQVDDDELGQTEKLCKLNGWLSKTLTLVGVLGGALLAWTVLTAVDWPRLGMWGAVGLAAVTGFCVALAAWWWRAGRMYR